MPDYRFSVETDLDREALRGVLARYRPFRVEVGFSNGFNTREFGDEVQYATPEPLAKLHYFSAALELDAGTRILDVGSHLGYYGHHFLRAGVGRYVGVEFDERIFATAMLLGTLSSRRRERMRFLNLDFGAPGALELLRPLGPFDVVLALATLNNIPSLTAALDNLAALAAPGAQLVLENLAIDAEEPRCAFHPVGYRGDTTLHWTFSQCFLDAYLGRHGIVRDRVLLDWAKEAVIGPGMRKIMALYRKPA